MRNSGNGTKRLVILLTAALFMVVLSAGAALAADKKPIVFADLGWDSVQVHNRDRHTRSVSCRRPMQRRRSARP